MFFDVDITQGNEIIVPNMVTQFISYLFLGVIIYTFTHIALMISWTSLADGLVV